MTQDTTWESDNNIIKHHIQESQDASPIPVGDHKSTLKTRKNDKHIAGIVKKIDKKVPHWNGK